jgi:hypothetical protein
MDSSTTLGSEWLGSAMAGLTDRRDVTGRSGARQSFDRLVADAAWPLFSKCAVDFVYARID